MQNVQFTICFASCASLLVPHSIGRICFLFISSQKILRNENCKIACILLLLLLWKTCSSVAVCAGKVLRQQRCVWLMCLTSGWQIDLYFVQMNRMIFIALQSGKNFIEYFWHVVILFLTQFVPSWRYIYAYKRCLLYIAVFICTSVIDTRLKCTALSTAASYGAVLQFSPLGVACVNAKCRHGPQKVAPKPSRGELTLAYASRTTKWYMGRNNRPEIRTLSHLVMCMQQAL